MSNSKLEGLSVGPVDHSAEVKASQASKGSMISSDRDRAVPEAEEIHSAIFSKSSKKCSLVAEDRGAHQGSHNNRRKDKT